MALLQVAGAEVRFGGVHALRGVDLTVDSGSVTGLIGPNGAGKTTLFNAICGLQVLNTGRITFDGGDMTGLRPHKRARLGIARTFQRLEVFGSLSVRENVLAAAEIRRRWSRDRSDASANADRVLALVGLSDLATRPAASSVATGTNFEMFESLLILAVVAIGGASVCSGALAGGLALGFLPGNAQDVFIGAGTIVLAFYADGVLPLVYDRFNRVWSGLASPRGRPVPVGREERAGSLAGSRAA